MNKLADDNMASLEWPDIYNLGMLIRGLDRNDHFVYSTAGQDRVNTTDDIDVTLYSLRRWAELACKGNPSVLHFLFAPQVRQKCH